MEKFFSGISAFFKMIVGFGALILGAIFFKKYQDGQKAEHDLAVAKKKEEVDNVVKQNHEDVQREHASGGDDAIIDDLNKRLGNK